MTEIQRDSNRPELPRHMTEYQPPIEMDKVIFRGDAATALLNAVAEPDIMGGAHTFRPLHPIPYLAFSFPRVKFSELNFEQSYDEGFTLTATGLIVLEPFGIARSE